MACLEQISVQGTAAYIRGRYHTWQTIRVDSRNDGAGVDYAIMRRAPFLCCLAGLACGRAASPSQEYIPDAGTVLVVTPPAPTAADAAAPAPVPEPAAVLAQNMARWGFDAPRKTRVLYTWTTREQFEILKKGGPVLQRSFSPGKGFASYDHAVYEQVAAGDEAAKKLWHEGFAKSRFAWSNAFGAVAYAGGETYGTVLLRITLKPQATFWDFYVEQGRLTWGAASASPTEVGGVWFANTKYREYVLSNESMIERVEAYTPSMQADIAAQLTFLRSLQNAETPLPAHQLNTFFPQLERIAGAAEVQTAIAALEALQRDSADPFERTIQATFSLGALRPPIDVLCKKIGVVVSKARMSTFGERRLYTPTCVALGKAFCGARPTSDRDMSRCYVLPSLFE